MVEETVRGKIRKAMHVQNTISIVILTVVAVTRSGVRSTGGVVMVSLTVGSAVRHLEMKDCWDDEGYCSRFVRRRITCDLFVSTR